MSPLDPFVARIGIAYFSMAIGHVAYYFNSKRMMRRYASEAYLR